MLRERRLLCLLPALIIAVLMRVGLDSNQEFVGSGSDVLNLVKPHYTFIKQQYAAGDLPLWNPYIATGQPEAAGAQWGVFYPIQWLLLSVLSPAAYIEWSIVFHLGLLGVVCFALASLWLKQRGVDDVAWPATLYAVAVTLCGFVQGHLYAGHVMLVQALPYLVAMIWGGVAILAGYWWGMAVSALGAAMSVLAGGAQIFPMALLVGLAIWATARSDAPEPRSWRRWAGLATALVLGGAIAGVQIAPTLELAAHSARSRVDLSATAGLFTISWRTFASVLLPGWADRVQAWAAWEFDGFVGAPVVALAVLPLVLRSSRKAGWVLWAVAIAMVAAGTAPVHGVVGRLPGYSMLRVPARLWLGPALLLPLVAAWGLARVAESRRTRLIGSALLGTALLITFVLLVGPSKWGGVGDIAVAVWCAICAVVIALPQPAQQHRRVAVVLVGAFAMALAAQGRYVFAPSAGLAKLPAPVVQRLQDQGPSYRSLAYVGAGWNAGMVDGFYNLAGYEPLASYRSALLFKALSGYAPQAPWPHSFVLWPAEGQLRYSPLWGLFGVRLVVTPASFVPPAPLRTVARVGSLAVYFDPRATPRAYFTTCPVPVPSPEQALNALMQQWAKDVDRPAAIEGIDAPACKPAPHAPEVRFVHAAAKELTIEATSDVGGYLVVNDLMLPGWRARVDGRSEPLRHANAAGRALALPPGRHRVEMSYAPDSVRYGAWLSLVGVLGLIGISWTARRGSGAGVRSDVQSPRHRSQRKPKGRKKRIRR